MHWHRDRGFLMPKLAAIVKEVTQLRPAQLASEIYRLRAEMDTAREDTAPMPMTLAQKQNFYCLELREIIFEAILRDRTL